MSRRQTTVPLQVLMNGQLVGQLQQTASTELRFTYDHAWLNATHARPLSLSLPLREQAYQDARVYHYFDNLLPDNEALRLRIQRRFALRTNDCFELLSIIGRDCVGALQLLPQSVPPPTQAISATPVTDKMIANSLSHYQQAPLGMRDGSDFRISIAGAQEKTAFLHYRNRWCVPTGATATTHIFKLPIGRIEPAGLDLHDSVENEWLCLQLLAAFGCPVNRAEIANFNTNKVLICERFDRQWQSSPQRLIRLPQEDLCQAFALPSALKYEADGGPGIENIMQFLQGSLHAQRDRIMFFKSCFLFWLLGAIDGHAKNFSIHLLPGGRFHLTPLYDVMSAYPLVAKKQVAFKKLKMAMSVKGKNTHYHWWEIKRRHWLDMGKRVYLDENVINTMIDEICDTMENTIQRVGTQLPKSFPVWLADAIFDGMRRVKQRCAVMT